MPLDGRRHTRETLVHDVLRDSDGIEEMRPAIAVDHADAHLRHHFGQAEFQRMQQILFAMFRVECASRLQGQPRTNRAHTHSQQHSNMVNLATIGSVHRDASLGANSGPGQRQVHCARSHRHRNRNRFRRCLAVREDQQRRAVRHQFHRALGKNVHRNLERRLRRVQAVQNRMRHLPRLRMVALNERVHLPQRQDRRTQREARQRLAESPRCAATGRGGCASAAPLIRATDRSAGWSLAQIVWRKNA